MKDSRYRCDRFTPVAYFAFCRLVWKCKDDPLSLRCRFQEQQLRNVFTTQTHLGCLAILGVASEDLSFKNSFNSLLVDGFITTTEYIELQSSSFFFDESVSRKRQRTDAVQVPETIPDTPVGALGMQSQTQKLGQQCDFLAFKGIEKLQLSDLINNSLHWHDVWLPLDGECFPQVPTSAFASCNATWMDGKKQR